MLTPQEKLKALQELRDPNLKMNRILADKSIAEAVLKMEALQGIKGEQGESGYTPVKNKDYFDGKDGSNGIDGKDSIVPGPRGVAGDTPIRGIHYWTQSDQDKIVIDTVKLIPKPKDGINPNITDVVSMAVDELKKKPVHINDIKGTEQLIEFLKMGGFRGGGSSSGGGGSGTVTTITAGTGLNGGTITVAGTISLANTAVTPGSYTNANITVDQQGRITLASNGTGGGGTPATPVNSVQFNNPLGTFAGDANFTYTTGSGLVVNNTIIQTGQYSSFGSTVPFVRITKGVDVYGTDNTIGGVQLGVGNTSSGISAYSFLYMNNDLAVSADSTHYAGLGYNSSGYTDTTFGTGVAIANQFQLWNTDGPITLIASKATAQYVNILIGGSATTNEIGRFGVTTNLTLNKSALGVTTADGLLLNNTTAAALAAQQISPSLHFQSFGWGTTASTSQSVDWRINSLPVQGATPSANLLMQFSLAGGAYTTELTLQSNGNVIANGAISGNGGLNTFSGSPQVANFFSNSGSSMVGTSTAPQANFGGGSATIYVRTLIGGTTTGTPANTSNGANLVIGSTPFTIANGSSSAWLVNTVINPLGTITLTGTGTVTNTASLYIGGASTGTVTGGFNYAVIVTAGLSSFQGGFVNKLTAVADVPYVALVSDYIVGYTTLTAARAVTLATTATYADGQIQIFKDEAGTAGTNNITVTPASGTIDGAANKVINANFGVLRLYKRGSNFFTF